MCQRTQESQVRATRFNNTKINFLHIFSDFPCLEVFSIYTHFKFLINNILNNIKNNLVY